MVTVEKRTHTIEEPLIVADAPAHFRHEYKYQIDKRQAEILKIKAAGILQPDSHVNANGIYVVRSLYFDDAKNTCFSENMTGTDPRSKFRIRYYNSDAEYLVLEKKSKVRGMCRKRSCTISAEECSLFLRGEYPQIAPEMSQIKRDLLSEIMSRGLFPKVIVTYERIPFVYSAGNVRVTFDQNVTASDSLDHFLSGNYPERSALTAGSSIMEVKWDELLPRHIRDTLCIENLSWTALSKFCSCRRLFL